jgi:hypothetical protein
MALALCKAPLGLVVGSVVMRRIEAAKQPTLRMLQTFAINKK